MVSCSHCEVFECTGSLVEISYYSTKAVFNDELQMKRWPCSTDNNYQLLKDLSNFKGQLQRLETPNFIPSQSQP